MMWHDYSVIERTVLVPPYVLTVAAGSSTPSAPALRFSPVDETETLTRVLRVTMNILVNEPIVSWWRAAVVARLVTIGSQDLEIDIHKLLPEEVRRSFRQHGVYLLDESNEVAFCYGAFRPDFVSTTSGTPSVIFRALKKTFASVERRRHLSMRPFSSLEFWSRLQQERDDCDAADRRAVAFAALREERMARASVAAHGGGLRDPEAVLRSRTVPHVTEKHVETPTSPGVHDYIFQPTRGTSQVPKGTPTREITSAARGRGVHVSDKSANVIALGEGSSGSFMTKPPFLMPPAVIDCIQQHIIDPDVTSGEYGQLIGRCSLVDRPCDQSTPVRIRHVGGAEMAPIVHGGQADRGATGPGSIGSFMTKSLFS